MARNKKGESPIDAFSSRLEVKAKRGRWQEAICPVHPDNSPTLRFCEGEDGAVVFKCMAGCDKGDILRRLGLEWPDVFPDRTGTRRPKQRRFQRKGQWHDTKSQNEYEYRDEDNQLLYVVTRWQFADPKLGKTFTQKRLLSNGDELSGLEAGWYAPDDRKKKLWHRLVDQPPNAEAAKAAGASRFEYFPRARRVLYRLREVLAAIECGEPVYLVEGEKDVNTLRGRGVTATTCAMGADHWEPTYNEQLAGASLVVIVADRDEAGYAGAIKKLDQLVNAGIACKVVEPTAGKDSTDHVMAGLGVDAFREIDPAVRLEEFRAYMRVPGRTKQMWTGDAPELTVVETVEPDEVIPPKGERGARLARMPESDLDNAELMLRRVGDRFRFCFKYESWFIWTGAYWQESETGAAKLLQEWFRVAREIERTAIGPDEKDYAKRCLGAAGMNAMEAVLRNVDGMPISPVDFDTELDLLPVANGTVNLRTGELGPHVREHLFTRAAPVEFDADADCPVWVEFLDRATGGDPELMEYLQLTVGYGLSGRSAEQVFEFLYGPAATGKSTFTKIVARLMGGFCRSLDKEHVTGPTPKGQIPDHLAVLNGSRVVLVAEVSDRDALNESMIKKLTGEDPIPVRRLYERTFDMLVTFKIWMFGNYRPRITDSGESMWRRLRAIPFNVVIPESERDTQLEQKLLAELPGILTWAVDGARKWYALWDAGKKRSVPACMQTAAREYREETDTIGQFLEDCTAVDPQERESSDDLHKAFSWWVREQGMGKPMSKLALARKLNSRQGLERYRDHDTQQRGFAGLRIKADVRMLMDHTPRTQPSMEAVDE